MVGISRYLPYRYRRKTRSVLSVSIIWREPLKKLAGAPFFLRRGGLGPLFVHFALLLKKKRNSPPPPPPPLPVLPAAVLPPMTPRGRQAAKLAAATALPRLPPPPPCYRHRRAADAAVAALPLPSPCCRCRCRPARPCKKPIFNRKKPFINCYCFYIRLQYQRLRGGKWRERLKL